MSELGDALRAVREARGLSPYQAYKATGVAQGNLDKIERGVWTLTYKTLYDLVTGYDLSKAEVARLFMLLVRDRMLEQAEEMAIWLFLSVADASALENMAAQLSEIGIPANAQFVQAVLLALAEHKEQAMQRRAVAPVILRSLTVSLTEHSAWIVPGPATEDLLSEEMALVASDADTSDSPSGG